MLARALAVLSTLAALLSMAAFSSTEVPSSMRVRTAPPDVRPFSHKEHVSEAWLRRGGGAFLPEVWRDCRGCHRFDAEHPVSAPQNECDNCHAGAGKLTRQFDEGWSKDLSGHRTRTRDGFRHHTHAMLECRECHAPFYEANGRADFSILEAHFEIQTGPGQCVRCHDGNADAGKFRLFEGALDPTTAAALGMQPFTKPDNNVAYAKKLLEVFNGPSGGLNNPRLPPGGDFDHGDHLAGFECVDCHTNVQRASAAEVGTGAIPLGKCADCHVTDAGRTAARAAPGVGPKSRPLQTLGTFAHSDHYNFRNGARKEGVCTPDAYAAIEKGCDSCHTYKPEAPGRAGRDFPFAEGTAKHRYQDCQQCHAVPGWSTGETKQAPLHASTGVGDGWKKCDACHLLGEPDLATRRPMVRIERVTERTFIFPTNTHPDVTKLGVQRAEGQGRAPIDDCRKCHRARVPELATRLAKQPFRHATHLSAAPTAADCAACHPTAAKAATPAALSADFRTYTLANCGNCHWGGDVTELIDEGSAAQAREVVLFPHGPHVDKAGLSCLACHELATNGSDIGRDITTKPSALSCNQCHDHERDPGTPGDPTNEGLFDGAVGSCVRCHHQPASGKPVLAVPPVRGSPTAAADPRYNAEQTLFAGFADQQFHPAGGDCTTCHKANLDAEKRLLPFRIPTVEKGHLGTLLSASVHAPDQPKGPAECLRCHWKPVGPWETAVQSAPGDEAAKKLRKAPGSVDTRKSFGNDREGYPGGDRARG